MSKITKEQEIEIQQKCIEVMFELYKNINVSYKTHNRDDIECNINNAIYDFKENVVSQYEKLNDLRIEINGRE